MEVVLLSAKIISRLAILTSFKSMIDDLKPRALSLTGFRGRLAPAALVKRGCIAAGTCCKNNREAPITHDTILYRKPFKPLELTMQGPA
jgi:hypothetical protein